MNTTKYYYTSRLEQYLIFIVFVGNLYIFPTNVVNCSCVTNLDKKKFFVYGT